MKRVSKLKHNSLSNTWQSCLVDNSSTSSYRSICLLLVQIVFFFHSHFRDYQFTLRLAGNARERLLVRKLEHSELNFQFLSHSLKFFVIEFMPEAHPRQMQLGMRSFQALQVQACPRSCDTSFNNIAFPIYRFQYYFNVSISCLKLLKTIIFSCPQRTSLFIGRFRLSRKTDFKGRYLKGKL